MNIKIGIKNNMGDDIAQDVPEISKSRWRVDKREVLHKNPWYEYRKDQGITDHQKPFNYFYVHKKQGSAGVVAVTDEGLILLVRQYRYLTNKDMLQIPGGNTQQLADMESVARHELLEETGYEAGTMQHLVDLSYAVGYAVDELSIFLAQHCRLVQAPQLEDSELGLVLEAYPIAEVYAMIDRAEFTDPSTVAALAVARSHLLKN